MIPSIPKIRDSLAAVELKEIEESSCVDHAFIVCERIGRLFPDGTRLQDEKALVMVQAPAAPIALSGLVSRIAEEIHGAGHAHCAPKSEYRQLLAGKVLAMAKALGSAKADPIDVVNSIIQSISATRITQWAVLINPATGADQYCFGDFVYGGVESEKLRLRCERAGSDYFDRYGHECRGKRSILRETSEVKTVSINEIRPPFPPDTSREMLMYRISDDYFGNLADAEQRRFLEDMDRQQAIYGAVGLGTVPAESLRRMAALTKWITVFDRKSRGNGWVVPNNTFFEISSTEPKALSDGHRAITAALRLEDWGKKPLDSTIQAYCQYLAAAQIHEADGHVEESLLHLVFALDLLLGGKAGESLTTILADRVAILTHLSLKRSQVEISNFVKECYDMRSGYAHRGERGRLEGLTARKDELMQVARGVLGAACFARHQPWAQSDDARTPWLARIDVLRAKQAAGMALQETEFVALGLSQVLLDPEEIVGISVDFSRSENGA